MHLRCTTTGAALAALALALAACHAGSDRARATAAPTSGAIPPQPRLALPIEHIRLANGLRVVLTRDPAAPVATVAIYYGVGARSEPRGRAGFAHLFEHMMFQGSRNLDKMEHWSLIEAQGGQVDGRTRKDFTYYFATVPSHVLEMVLWAEADRMRGLALTEDNLRNQKDVIANEARGVRASRPYGGFPWRDLPEAAFTSWSNTHDGIGELADLEPATLSEIQTFFDTYYAPSNAVLAIAGDFEPARVRAWIDQYFGGLRASEPPPVVDVSEPRQVEERRRTVRYPLADRPALAVGWRLPPRGTRAFWAMSLVRALLSDGKDSLLHGALVQRRGYTGDITSWVNVDASPYSARGPALLSIALYHDAATSADAILAAIDEETARVGAALVDDEAFARARVKARAELYGMLDTTLDRAGALAIAALFDGDPALVNRMEAELLAVTREDLRAAAREVLRRDNRTVVIVEPGGAVR